MAPAPITHVQLIRDWRRTLDAFGDALADEEEQRDFTPSELKELAWHLDADRRWLRCFAALRSFP